MWILSERGVERSLFFGPFATYNQAGDYRIKRGLAATRIEPLIEIEPEPDRAAEEGARAVEEALRRELRSSLAPPAVKGSPDAFRG